MEVTPQIIEANWPLTDVIISKPLQDPSGMRSVLSIQSAEGKYIAKTADSYKTRQALIENLRAFELLPQKGFSHIPKLFKLRSGVNFF